MGKIDTSEWKEFRIKDLFETQKKGNKLQVPTGASVPVQDLLEDGATPRITVTGSNNGIFGFYDYCGKNIADYRVFNNFVSVSFLGTVFYQEGDATLDMKVHCLKPKGITLNKYTGRFLVGAIRASLRESTYSDQISSSILPEMSIKLPATPDGAPDWAYMESYMANLEAKVAESLTLLQAAKDEEKKKVDTREWGEFRVGELFDAERGKVKNIQPLTPGATPIIAAGAYNQGIAGMYDIDSAYKNRITVSCNGAGCGSTFYHPYEFNVNGDAITLIEKKCMSDRAKQFVACILNATFTRKFSYEEKCSPQKALAEAMRLPIDKTGQPDWAYMEEYMRKVKERVKVTMEKYEMTVNEVAL